MPRLAAATPATPAAATAAARNAALRQGVHLLRSQFDESDLVGQSDHGVSLSLYAKDPDGLEFEVFWTVPGGLPVGTRALDLDAEVARWATRRV